ncbi:hypothetical protein BC30090_p303 (plasmid) [Bacillus cereus]|nr:hypothetical protein BC30090_p303 [Bacillus cereus]
MKKMKEEGSLKEKIRKKNIMIMLLMIMKMNLNEKTLDLLKRIKRARTMNLKKNTANEKRKMMHTFTDGMVVLDIR